MDSAPLRAAWRMCLSFLPPARRAVVQGCGTIWATHTHTGEWIYPLSGRENIITAIRKQTAGRLSNLPNIRDLVAGRTLQLKTISLVSAERLSPKSIFLPLALIKRERATFHQAGFHQGYSSQLQDMCLFIPCFAKNWSGREKSEIKTLDYFLQVEKWKPLWDKR